MFEKGLLAKKRILITGGGSGLGAAMGARFAELGAELIICGRREALLEGREGETTETMLSAQNNPNAVATLREQLLDVLPENPFFFPVGAASDQSREMWAAEIIREEAMKKLRDELPYAVATRVNTWTEREDGLQRIEGEIVVEKNQHKGMVIGAGGKQLREIGQAVREINNVTANIASAIGQQDAATREISANAQMAAQGNETLVTNVGSLRDDMDQTSKAAESVLAASNDLTATAETLSREVEQFFRNLRSDAAEDLRRTGT